MLRPRLLPVACSCPAWPALNLGAIRPDEVAIWMARKTAGRRLSASRRRADEPGLHHEAADHAVGAGAAGPDYRWRTELLADARPRGDTLDDPLYWKAAATRTLTATTWRRWRATCAGAASAIWPATWCWINNALPAPQRRRLCQRQRQSLCRAAGCAVGAPEKWCGPRCLCSRTACAWRWIRRWMD